MANAFWPRRMVKRPDRVAPVTGGLVRATVCTLLAFGAAAAEAEPGEAEPGEADRVSQSPVRLFTFTAVRWGGPIDIRLYERDAAAAKDAADSVFALAKQIDEVFSDYDPDSGLNQFCRAVREGVAAQDGEVFTPFEVSVPSGLMRVLEDSSRRVATQTPGGLVDPTIGPLTHLWRKARRLKRLPTDEQIATARASVGFEKLQLQPAPIEQWGLDPNPEPGRPDLMQPIPHTVLAAPPQLQLDFGAFLKGLALDEMRRAMKRRGVKHLLIDAGGDIVCAGFVLDESGEPSRPWRVGIAPTVNVRDAPQTFLNLGTRKSGPNDLAIATSGDAAQHMVLDGRRYSHIIDPRTGQPIERSMSVTVLATSGVAADSVATALNIVGPDGADEFFERLLDPPDDPSTQERRRQGRRLPLLIGRIAWIDDNGEEQLWVGGSGGRDGSAVEVWETLLVEPESDGSDAE